MMIIKQAINMQTQVLMKLLIIIISVHRHMDDFTAKIMTVKISTYKYSLHARLYNAYMYIYIYSMMRKINNSKLSQTVVSCCWSKDCGLSLGVP